MRSEVSSSSKQQQQAGRGARVQLRWGESSGRRVGSGQGSWRRAEVVWSLPEICWCRRVVAWRVESSRGRQGVGQGCCVGWA